MPNKTVFWFEDGKRPNVADALDKNIPQTDRSLRTERGIPRESFKGRTVGLVGLGEVGTRVARICGLGLQMRVIAYDPFLTAEQCQARGVVRAERRNPCCAASKRVWR